MGSSVLGESGPRTLEWLAQASGLQGARSPLLALLLLPFRGVPHSAPHGAGGTALLLSSGMGTPEVTRWLSQRLTRAHMFPFPGTNRPH